MPPSKRKLKAQAAIAEAPHVKAAKARRARDHDADPDAAGERRHAQLNWHVLIARHATCTTCMHDRTDHIGAMSSMVDAMSSMTALTKTEERG